MTATPPADRWRRIEAIFVGALDKPAAERADFIAMACGEDEALRQEILSLVSAHERTGMLEKLAESLAAAGSAARFVPLEGRTIGRYAVGERIGGGGMGVVHKAYDRELDRTLALKFLQGHLDTDVRAAERFRQEARAIAALEHPNICSIYEVGETPDGERFIAMPLYEGETVQQRIGRGRLPVAEALDITRQVLRALTKAHARGIIHRDIKPSNVFLTSDGVVKLLDFGIAKLTDATLTGTAGPIGTLAYMSPEQAMGAPVDARTDVWSVGVMLYEMLAGERPYVSGVAAAMTGELRAMVPRSLREMRPEIPHAVEQAVGRALQRAPEARFASAADFERALSGSTSGPVHGTTPSRPTADARSGEIRRSRRWLMGAAAVLFGAAVLLWNYRRAPQPVVTAEAPVAAAPTLAVLPFLDRTTEAGRDFFGDGITEELIATLSRVEGLKVASTTSVFAYKNKLEDVRAIGEKLGVGAVLEGSVRQSGQQLRIVARLVNVADGLQLWTEQYDRPVGDAFTIQSDIARAIAQVLQVKLVGLDARESGGYRPNPEAYELYLQASAVAMRALIDGSGAKPEVRTERERLLNEAVRIDPKFAAAWNTLAENYSSQGFSDRAPPNELFPKAEYAAKQAIAADSTFAQAYNTLAYVQLYYNWNVPASEETFRRVVTLRPGYSRGHQWYGNALMVAGRFDEAAREMQRAQETDSTSLVAIAAEAWVYNYQRDYAKARRTYQRALRRNPNYMFALLWGAWNYDVMDSLPQAVRDLRTLVSLSDSTSTHVAALAYALVRNGEAREGRELFRRILAREAKGEYIPSYEIAKLHLVFNERDALFARLERALANREHSMMLLALDPQFDPVRTDPRFVNILERIGKARR